MRKVSKSTFNLKSVTKTLSLVSLIEQIDNDLFYLHFFTKIASIMNKAVILRSVICQQKHLNFLNKTSCKIPMCTSKTGWKFVGFAKYHCPKPKLKLLCSLKKQQLPKASASVSVWG